MNYREFPDINGPEVPEGDGEESLPFDYEADDDEDWDYGEIDED